MIRYGGDLMTQTVLILGSSGRFGRASAAAFRDAGWQVRRVRRGQDSLPDAAKGADLIVNGWNPPYTDWAAHLPDLTEAVIQAAKVSGATVLIPGNVYVFGPGAPEILESDTPHRADHPLGRLRLEMEARYLASGVPTILLRAGDFLDTTPSGNWFDRIIAARAPQGQLRYPGDLSTPHAWAFLPDLARAALALAEQRADLAPFEDVPFDGYTLTAEQLAAAATAALGHPVRAQRMSWLPIRLARPVWPMARHLLEMRYLWDLPHRLDGAKLRRLLPGWTPTPLETALRLALDHQINPDQAVA